jgi:GR25 family glycosyltransferase involved in LPS biosynthesis
MGIHTSTKWNNIDLIYYINISHRTDREKLFQKELGKMAFEPSKIHKLYASTGGFMGCTKSHIRSLQMALASGANKIAIFEDDFMLTMKIQNAVTLIDQFFKVFPNANVLMLQSNPIEIQSTAMSGISKVKKALSTAGYIIKVEYIPTMIRNLQQSLKDGKPFDIGLFQLQSTDHWYALQPPMGKQRPSFSDIENKFVNYGL